MLKPLYDKVVVKREGQAAKIGSLYVADVAQEKPQRGVVVAVGDGKHRIDGRHTTEHGADLLALRVKVGDTVVFTKFAGVEVEDDGAKYLIMSEDEILAVAEKPSQESGDESGVWKILEDAANMSKKRTNSRT